MENSREYVLKSLLLVIGVIAVGTLGYMLIEGWGFLDALYMTVITISTVGFREKRALSPIGSIFTIFLIFMGVGAVLYLLTRFIEYTIEGGLSGTLMQRRWYRKLRDLKEHYIICGFGRVGSHVAEELGRYEVPFVVIDNSPQAISRARGLGYTSIEGDATDEEILRLAGVERAKGLIACLPSDAVNLYAILSARAINPNIFLVARVEHEEAEDRFLKLGVNRVVSLHSTAGKHMARLALNPFIEETMEIVIAPQFRVLLEQIEIPPYSHLVNKRVEDVLKDCGEGMTVVGLRKGDQVIWNPPPQTAIEPGDTLIVSGSTETLLRFVEGGGSCKAE